VPVGEATSKGNLTRGALVHVAAFWLLNRAVVITLTEKYRFPSQEYLSRCGGYQDIGNRTKTKEGHYMTKLAPRRRRTEQEPLKEPTREPRRKEKKPTRQQPARPKREKVPA